MTDEKIELVNSRGLKLAGKLSRPDKAEGKLPVVLLVHGFTGHKDEGHISSLAEELAKSGIASVRFDAEGFGGESEGTLEDDYRFSHQLADTEEQLEWLRKQDWADASRIGIWGHSMGGQITVIVTSRDHDISAMCACQPSNDVRESPWLKSVLPQWKKDGYYDFESSKYGTLRLPFAFYEDRAHFNAAEVAGEITCPQLYIAGGADKTVPVTMIKPIYEAANEPKEYYEHPKATHGYKNQPEVLREINDKIVSWFKDNL